MLHDFRFKYRIQIVHFANSRKSPFCRRAGLNPFLWFCIVFYCFYSRHQIPFPYPQSFACWRKHKAVPYTRLRLLIRRIDLSYSVGTHLRSCRASVLRCIERNVESSLSFGTPPSKNPLLSHKRSKYNWWWYCVEWKERMKILLYLRKSHIGIIFFKGVLNFLRNQIQGMNSSSIGIELPLGHIDGNA